MKIWREHSSFIEIWQKNGALHEEKHTFMISSYFFLEWEMFQKNLEQNQNKHFMMNNFSSKIVPLVT